MKNPTPILLIIMSTIPIILMHFLEASTISNIVCVFECINW